MLEADRHFMKMALTMARRGLGTTAPNPCVGAVIVDDNGVLLGRGWTQPGGRPHAEVEALARAGEAARGATLFVTLEPCSHTGKSPPCADAVIEAGIRRVVCALHDPDERVAGRGFAKLREVGIEVVENVLRDEAHWLTLGHILRVTKQRPFVQLKLATDADGLIAPGEGVPVWVTGEEARARGHLLRAQADAILVGIGTVLADDPALDCRLPGLEKNSPEVFVLDSRLHIPNESRLVNAARERKVNCVTTFEGCETKEEEARAETMMSLNVGVWCEPLHYNKTKTFLAELLQGMSLHGNDITRLLVEGGPHVWRSFLEEGLVDEVVHFEGTGQLGKGGLLPFIDKGLERIRQDATFKMVDQRTVGSDKMTVYKNTKSSILI